MKLNRFQKIALQAYSNGDFAYILDIKSKDEAFEEIKETGEKLLYFILKELEESNINSAEDATRYLELAINQLSEVIDSLENKTDEEDEE